MFFIRSYELLCNKSQVKFIRAILMTVKQQKILPNNVTLTPVDSARNIGIILDKNLSFSQHFSSIFQILLPQYSRSTVYSQFMDRSTTTTILLLRLSLILKLTTATLSCSISLLLKSIVSNLF
jgi:hypothetical protein